MDRKENWALFVHYNFSNEIKNTTERNQKDMNQKT